MSKHTPGPWKVDQHFGLCCAYSIATIPNDGRVRFRAHVDNYGVERGEVEANARLIAAAPDMLEVLQRIRAVIGLVDDKTPLPDNLYGLLAEVIKKAEGGS